MPCQLLFLVPAFFLTIITLLFIFLIKIKKTEPYKNNKKRNIKVIGYELLSFIIIIMIILTISSIPDDSNDFVTNRVQFIYKWCVVN